MEFSDLRGLDAVVSAALAALGGRQIFEAIKTGSRTREIERLRGRIHGLAESLQSEMLKRAVLETRLATHVEADEAMHERVEIWMDRIDEKLDKLLLRGLP